MARCGTEWNRMGRVVGRKSTQNVSGRLKTALSPPKPKAVAIVNSRHKQQSQCRVVTSYGGPAMNTRSKSTHIPDPPDAHRVQQIDGLSSFIIKGSLTDSSHQDAHCRMYSHFNQLLKQL
ncbi:hypothetical protein ACHAXM_000430 [Skeletonema potamos]|jgi:hypothetical protein